VAVAAAASVTQRSLLYLAVTFTVQRMVVMARAQHRAIPGQAEATGLV
jgi:hypothetical protein